MIIMTMMTMMMMMTMVTSVGTATTRAGRSAVGVSSHGVPHMLRLVVQARAFQAMGTPVGTTTVTCAAAMVERQHTIMVTYYYGSEDAMWIAAVVARAMAMNEITFKACSSSVCRTREHPPPTVPPPSIATTTITATATSTSISTNTSNSTTSTTDNRSSSLARPWPV